MFTFATAYNWIWRSSRLHAWSVRVLRAFVNPCLIGSFIMFVFDFALLFSHEREFKLAKEIFNPEKKTIKTKIILYIIFFNI